MATRKKTGVKGGLAFLVVLGGKYEREKTETQRVKIRVVSQGHKFKKDDES